MDRPPLAINSGERQRIERVLAVARALLATGAALVLGLDQLSRSGSLSKVPASLLGLYVLHSYVVLWLLKRGERSATFRAVVHAGDLCWPLALSVFSPGSDNTPWVLWFFAINAAACRWGSWPALATTGFTMVLVVLEPGLQRVSAAAQAAPITSLVEPRELMLRAAYVLLFGVPLAYLAARSERRRVERAAIAQLVRTPRPALSMTRTMHALLDQLLSMMKAREALIVVRETGAGRSILWQTHAPAGDGQSTVHMLELDESEEQHYLFPAQASGWDVAQRSRGPLPEIVAVDAEGRRSSPPPGPNLAAFAARHPSDSLVVVSFAFAKEWTGRLFVLDPKPARDREGRLRFLHAALRELSPALHNTYLLRRMRSRAGAVERARLARELHDGITQSLIGAQMQLELARRHLTTAPVQVVNDLEQVQRILQHEVSDLRDIMRGMKTADVPPTQLVGTLAESVERFERETGIAARLVTSDVDSISLSQRTCTELGRIVREALANVRRHSGARHVLVRFGAEAGRYVLIVEDDGHGFSHIGNGSAGVPAETRQVTPPAAIAESVRAMGGDLRVESSPGEGTRIEVTVDFAELKAAPSREGPRPFSDATPHGKLAMAKARLSARSASLDGQLRNLIRRFGHP